MKKSLLLLAFFSLGLVAYGGTVKVTFSVDLSIYQKNGYFNPTTDTVWVAGDFNSWSTTANALARGTGADTAIYSAQVSSVPSGAINYKFLFVHSGTTTWDGDPNRTGVIGSNDTTLPTAYFNRITGKENHVWFKVDMTLPLKSAAMGLTDTVGVTGDFTGWGTSGTGFLMMTKDAHDSDYAVLADSLTSGRTINFKFIYFHGGVQWESPTINTVGGNRTYFVPEQDSSLDSVYWSDVNPNVQLGTGNINFTCDMGVMTAIGIFNPAQDSVLISAGFNGWTTNDPTAWMQQNPINDSEYFFTQAFVNAPYGDNPYKYYVKKHNPTGLDTLWTDGYERPIHWLGGNRETTFHGLANQDTSDYYDDILPDWIVPAGTNLKVTFTVNMNPAMNPALQAVPFNPATDVVYFESEQPTFRRTQGWWEGSTDTLNYFPLTAKGNGIYSGTLTVKDPTFNAFQYIYEFKSGSTWTAEPISFGVESRVRFVGQDAPNHFPKNPWTMPMDTWTNNEIKPDQEVNPYISLTGVRTITQVTPNTYTLSQNYPNPFNPSTKINFSIQKAGLVTLKVYNILGQEVATLVNYELKAGTYSSVFDASRFSSGVYFYTIRSGNFVQSKKMMLLK
jgi:Secretion system C-terminal sorting domain